MANLFCLVCSKSFPETELSGHVTSVHFGFLPFACTSCDFTAAQEAEVLQHADKEGHIPFVVDRSNAKPYLTSLSKQIVGHCKIFSVSKNFAGILAGLNSQIAADLSSLGEPKCEVRSERLCNSEISSERSMSTPQSTLANSLKSDAGVRPCSVSNGVCGLSESLSHSVDTPKSNSSAEFLTTRNESTAMCIDSSSSDVLPEETDQNVSNVAMELCVLCASNEAYSSDQREGHVLEHLARNGTATASSSANPAAYFSELAKMWRLCFPPPTALNAGSNSVGDAAVSPDRQHITKRTCTSIQKKYYVTCSQCGKCMQKHRKPGHVRKCHMPGFDRFVCTVCGGKAVDMTTLKRACALSHSGVRAEVQVTRGMPPKMSNETVQNCLIPSGLQDHEVMIGSSSLASSADIFDQQFELCFGHLPHPVDRPFGKSFSSSAPVPAVSNPDVDAPCGESLSAEPRYPSRRSLSAQKVDRADSSLQSATPPRKAGGSLKLSSCVTKLSCVRRFMRNPTTGKFVPLAPSKVLKRRTKRESPTGTVPNNVPVPDLGSAKHARALSKIPTGRPKKIPRRRPSKNVPPTLRPDLQACCNLCNNQKIIRNRHYAAHVWSHHMSGHKRLTCEVCDAKHNVSTALTRLCKANHPESKPIVKVAITARTKTAYKQQYLLCFGKLPISSGGFPKPLKLQRSNADASLASSPSPSKIKHVTANVPAVKSQSTKLNTAKCQLCSLIVKFDGAILRRHALGQHLSCKAAVYECSKCGYSRQTEPCKVVYHIRAVHADDANARVIDRSARFAGKIQQCLDSCFPNLGLSVVKWKRQLESEDVPLLREATITDQPSTSGCADFAGVNEHLNEVVMDERESDGNDDCDEEASLAAVKRELLRQSGAANGGVAASSAADLFARMKAVLVKAEEIND